MVTVRWHVTYIEEGKKKETEITLTGNTYPEISPVYIERLSAFKRLICSELVEYKEEEQIPQTLTLGDKVLEYQ